MINKQGRTITALVFIRAFPDIFLLIQTVRFHVPPKPADCITKKNSGHIFQFSTDGRRESISGTHKKRL